MAGVNTIELSDKALAFVQGRRNGQSVDQYVNQVLESLCDQGSLAAVYFGGGTLLDLVESGAGPEKLPGLQDDSNQPVRPEAIMIYASLQKAPEDAVSGQVFRGKCREAGLADDEIAYAERFLFPGSRDAGSAESAAPAPAPAPVNKVTLVLYELRREYPGDVPADALRQKCKDKGLSDEEIRSIEQVYARRAVASYNEMVSERVATGTDFRKSMLDIKIIKLLDELKLRYGNLIPATAYIDRCKEMGFTEEDLAYAKTKYGEFIDALISYEDVKYVSSKAYIILEHLRKSYPGKVPYSVFYSRCKAMGISRENIESAVRQAGHLIDKDQGAERLEAGMLGAVAADLAKGVGEGH